jgi:hypothetical protein
MAAFSRPARSMRKGVLWFPTQAGLIQVDPARIARNLRPARPVIESVSVHDALAPVHPGSSTAWRLTETNGIFASATPASA